MRMDFIKFVIKVFLIEIAVILLLAYIVPKIL